MKCFNKLKADYAVLLSFISCMFFMGSCNIAYQYDIESGTEDDTADSTNVTIVTGEGIDVSMYESARVFPGLVDTLVDNTVNTLLALDLSKRYIPAYDLDVQQVPRPIYSTGLYAGAGELFTITINDNTMGLTVIIGSHLDDLKDISPYLRLPVVTTSKQLFPGKNTIRNPLGGMIWIEKSKYVNGSADFVMEINGAYRSPDFIVGSTDVTAWVEQLRTTTVPWLELRGRHVAFSIHIIPPKGLRIVFFPGNSCFEVVTGEGIDVSMYESARVFPGLVDTLVDNTVNTLLALDLSKRYIPAYDLDVQLEPR